MKTTSSESKVTLERSGKGLVTSLGFKTKLGSQKYKKARYAIGNFSEKDFSKIIKEFKKIGKVPYEKKRPKHEPTDSYFHLAGQLAKCMIRSDKLNRHDSGGYTKMTAPSSDVNVMKESKLKEIIMHETLLENNSTDVSEPERNIVNENLSQNNSADEPENTITELKDE